MQAFDYERLDVYVAALDFVTTADALAKAASRGYGDLADQLRRASTSVLLNLAEGAGEFAPREKARFYRLAKRSGTECAALVEIYRRLELVEPQVADQARAALLRIVSMLVRLIVSTESGDRRSERGGYA
jgi:four helix bundle protein